MNFHDFLSQPFRQDMDLVNWLVFVGIITAAVILWTRILNQIEPFGE